METFTPSVPPRTDISLSTLEEAIRQLLPAPLQETSYIDVDGPAVASDTLIRFDVPYAIGDPRRSLRLRKTLGLPAEERVVDPNVRVVIDSFISPRRWVEAESGAVWVQRASPFPSSRVEAAETQQRLQEKLAELHVRSTGTSSIRALLVAECMLEVLRQVTTECWERGLVLLHVHAERVAAQVAQRCLFESRVGHAFRLALKGEKDFSILESDMGKLGERIAALEAREVELKKNCDEFSAYAEEQTLIAAKKHNDELAKLKKEGLLKKNQLERLLTVPANLQ